MPSEEGEMAASDGERLQNASSGISQSGPRYLTGEITLRVDISPEVRYLN